jgi:hypothetical protein
MATDWPSTLPSFGIDFYEDWEMPVTKTSVETGIEKVRPMWTQPDRIYTITFPGLDADDKTDLTDYFEDIGWGGGIIRWTHPTDASVIYVRLDGPLSFTHLGGDQWATTFRLKRVPDEVAI